MKRKGSNLLKCVKRILKWPAANARAKRVVKKSLRLTRAPSQKGLPLTHSFEAKKKGLRPAFQARAAPAAQKKFLASLTPANLGGWWGAPTGKPLLKKGCSSILMAAVKSLGNHRSHFGSRYLIGRCVARRPFWGKLQQKLYFF